MKGVDSVNSALLAVSHVSEDCRTLVLVAVRLLLCLSIASSSKLLSGKYLELCGAQFLEVVLILALLLVMKRRWERGPIVN